MDAFVIAHLLGWYGKAVVLRDYWFCWILSVMFEVMEYSLAHQLNNFAECWWDHVSLKVQGQDHSELFMFTDFKAILREWLINQTNGY